MGGWSLSGAVEGTADLGEPVGFGLGSRAADEVVRKHVVGRRPGVVQRVLARDELGYGLVRAAEPMAFGDGLQPGYGARQAEAEKIGERSSSGEGLGKLAVGAGRCRSGPLSRR